MTRAPRLRALAPVASREPSSTTMISLPRRARRAAARRRRRCASASFIAGMTTETREGSAKQLLHDAVPGHRCARARARPRRAARRSARSAASRATAAPIAAGSGAQTKPFSPSTDELERAAGVGRGDDRLRARTPRASRSRSPRRTARRRRRARRRTDRPARRRITAPAKTTRSCTPVSGGGSFGAARCDPSPTMRRRSRRRHVRHRADREVRALDALEPADDEHVVAVRSRRAGGRPAAADGTAPAAATPLKRLQASAVLRALVKTRRHSPSICASSSISRWRRPTSASVCSKSLYGVPHSS